MIGKDLGINQEDVRLLPHLSTTSSTALVTGAIREESPWACFSCGRAQRMTHRWDAPDDEVTALAKHQHNSRAAGRRGRRCAFDSVNVRITRHVEGTKLVGFEVPQ